MHTRPACAREGFQLTLLNYGKYYALMAAGPSPFPAAEKDQKAAAAPDALNGSA